MTTGPGATWARTSYSARSHRGGPGGPSNLVASPQGKHISLSWTYPALGVTVNLYRGTSSGGESLYATGLTSQAVNDFGVLSGVTYYYHVTAVSATGAESGRSTEASATAK